MKKPKSCTQRAGMAKSLFSLLITLLSISSYGQWTGTSNPVSGSAYLTPTSTNPLITGNVGIGTTTPQQKLVLEGSETLWFRMKNNAAGGSQWSMGPSSTSWVIGGGKFVISDTEASADASFVIDAARNVGIGQTSPTDVSQPGGNAKLVIKGSTVQNGQAGADWNLKLQSARTGGVDWLIGSTGDGWDAGAGKFVINKGSGSSSQSPFVITSAGSVGINAISPPAIYKLAVGGKAIAEEIVVKLQANWPDYVFEDTYKLPSLLEVERYIRENKHLPEVPSAQEVKENGLAVGEMNALLLKKIEELTLYVVELKKESIESQQKVAELQKEVEALKSK